MSETDINLSLLNLNTGDIITDEKCDVIDSNFQIIQNSINNNSDKIGALLGLSFSFVSTDWILITSGDSDYVTGLTLYKTIVNHTLNTTLIKNYNCYNSSNELMYCIIEPINSTSIKIISDESFNGNIVLF
jgi:hypothetical protein